MNWQFVGSKKGFGLANSITIPAATVTAADDIQATVLIKINSGVWGKVYYTCVSKNTENIISGFYYDNKYYGSIMVSIIANDDGSLTFYMNRGWTNIVANGATFTDSDLSGTQLNIWYR